MATKVDLTGELGLFEANDEEIKVTLTTNEPTEGTPLDLTGATLEAFLKAAASTADNDAGVWIGTTAAEITVTDGPNGKASIEVPASAVTPTKKWWRIDVISDGKRKTALYGDVAVTDL